MPLVTSSIPAIAPLLAVAVSKSQTRRSPVSFHLLSETENNCTHFFVY
jgi:hypothetical protein